MNRVFQSILIVIATLVVLLLLWELRVALVLFVLSLAVAASTRSPAEFLIKRGVPRSLAIILTYLLGVIVLAVLFYLFSGSVLRDMQQATNLFDREYRQISGAWPEGTPFQQMVVQQLPPPQDLYDAVAGRQGAQLMQNFLGIASGFMASAANLGIILVLSVYWSFDRLYFERLWISLLPVERRGRAREIWRELEDGVGGYIRSELIQSVIAGLLLGIGYYWMGLSFPALIALIGALLWLVPWLGAGLAVVLPLLAGLNAGPALAVAAPVYTVVVLTFLEHVVEPRIFDRRRYSSLLIIIVLAAMAVEYGLMGLLLAPPLAAALQTLFSSLMRPTISVSQQDLANKVDTLQKRVVSVREQVAGMEVKPSPEVVNLLGRLSNVMEQANQIFETDEKL